LVDPEEKKSFQGNFQNSYTRGGEKQGGIRVAQAPYLNYVLAKHGVDEPKFRHKISEGS